MAVELDPTKEVPLPYTEAADKNDTFKEDLEVTANTVTALEQLGTPPEIELNDALKTTELLKAALKKQDSKALAQPMVAFGAKEFVRTYSARLAVEVSDIRTALTNKLLELANCGDPRFELKALELLGKHSDIGLFTERSEITINHTTSDALEKSIKDRVKRLLNADITDVKANLIDELDDEHTVLRRDTHQHDDADHWHNKRKHYHRN